jgi:O-antigen ligase
MEISLKGDVRSLQWVNGGFCCEAGALKLRDGAPILPVLALGMLAFAWGNFPGAAEARGATGSQLLLLSGGAAAAIAWRRLGRRLRRRELAALVLLWLAAALAFSSSTVPRAGRAALALLPLAGILPWLAAELWAAGRGLRLAVRSLALLLAAVASHGLWGAFFGGTPGASLPLGHHNQLAVFLLMLLPAPLALGWRGGAQDERSLRLDRLLAIGAGGLGLTALAATRSLGGALAFLVGLLLFLPAWRGVARFRWLKPAAVAAGIGLLGLGLLPRLLNFGEEIGVSSEARHGYLLAGWRGFLEAPWIGHGPGSTAWLFSRYFEPEVAVHPPDHIVADLHDLPLQVLFEVGLVGFLAAATWLFLLLRPLFATPTPDDPFRAALVRGSRAFLVAALVFSATGFLLAVPALPVAFLLLAGLGRAALGEKGANQQLPYGQRGRLARLLAVERGRGAGGTLALPGGRTLRFGFLTLVAAALFWLLPGLRAQWAWERARSAEDSSAARWALEEAVAIDPDFPLYRARVGILAGNAEQLIEAADAAGAVGPVTLQAGLAAEAAAIPAAEDLLARACDLDPFGGLAPFRLAVGPAGGADELRVERAMRALVAEPRLVAAIAWRQYPHILQRAQVLLDRQGTPLGWSAALLPSMEKVLGRPPGETADLVLRIDREPAEAVSLYVFRRSPWPAELARVQVRRDAVPADMPPALSDPAMRPDFAAPGCRWRPPAAPDQGINERAPEGTRLPAEGAGGGARRSPQGSSPKWL